MRRDQLELPLALCGGRLGEQVERCDAEEGGEFFDRLQAQVALAALDPADIGAMKAEVVGQLLLAQITLDADLAQSPAEKTL